MVCALLFPVTIQRSCTRGEGTQDILYSAFKNTCVGQIGCTLRVIEENK